MRSAEAYQAKKRTKAVVAVYLILFSCEGNKILTALRRGTGYQDENWELPSGHVDDDELPAHAVCREAAEELGITVKPADVKCVHAMYRPAHDRTGNRVDFFFLATKWDGEPRVLETDKCGGLQWVGLNSLPHNLVPHPKHALQCWQDGTSFSQLGKEWLLEHGLWEL